MSSTLPPETSRIGQVNKRNSGFLIAYARMKPTPMAMKARIRRVRSSCRCSMSDIRACSGVSSMVAGGVISSLGTVRDDRLCFLGRHRRWRLDGGRFGLRRGRRHFGGRLVEHLGQFVEDGIARQAQLAQDFSHSAHNLGQALGADDNQRDREDQSYFKKVQTSMTIQRAS